MHIHLLGIGGTFMSALSLLAREAGFHVTGSDANCYPPVSDLLANKDIHWTEGYDDSRDALAADCVIVGNAIKRGTPVLEAVLDAKKPYTSGPQWLAENILPRYRVLAVTGTHGKTTTTSMLAFILQHAGLQPGFLIGGVASNFSTSACLGDGEWFVIEADEYDSAFFDKRPKFMHYRPELAILNNLEFDHADIYANLAAIQQQFQYFLRTIPSNGLVLKPRDDEALNEVLTRACYSRVQDMALSGKAVWRAELLDAVGRAFRVWHKEECVAEVHWSLIGQFNVENALAAIAASVYAGVSPKDAATALAAFQPVKRRLELKAEHHGVSVYDDFAHHPSAIAKTLAALKASARHQRVLVVLEFASYTMRQGVQAALLESALATADAVYVLQPKDFSFTEVCQHWAYPIHVLASVDAIMDAVCAMAQAGDAILVMSNRGFENIHQRLSERLEVKGR